MSDKVEIPITLKPVSKQSDLKRGDVFLWKSGMTGKFEIHTFKEDGGYGAETFTEPYGEGGGLLTVNYSGICGLLIPNDK